MRHRRPATSMRGLLSSLLTSGMRECSLSPFRRFQGAAVALARLAGPAEFARRSDMLRWRGRSTETDSHLLAVYAILPTTDFCRPSKTPRHSSPPSPASTTRNGPCITRPPSSALSTRGRAQRAQRQLSMRLACETCAGPPVSSATRLPPDQPPRPPPLCGQSSTSGPSAR